MPLFNRKPTTVDAEQFTDMGRPPRGVLTEDVDGPSVMTMQGRVVPVSVGEWIVAEPDGKHFYPIADSQFRSIYEATDVPALPSGSLREALALALGHLEDFRQRGEFVPIGVIAQIRAVLSSTGGDRG